MEWPKVLESLVASGPLALVCGSACVVLWRELQKERAARVEDLKSMLKPKP
jgi:hypothetical protein